jgi:hypothetical protein
MYTFHSINNNILQYIPVKDGETVSNKLPITLVGKDLDYGSEYQTNLYRVVENFCSGSKPLKPVEGMLWYNDVDNRLRVYVGNNVWKIVVTDEYLTEYDTLALEF